MKGLLSSMLPPINSEDVCQHVVSDFMPNADAVCADGSVWTISMFSRSDDQTWTEDKEKLNTHINLVPDSLMGDLGDSSILLICKTNTASAYLVAWHNTSVRFKNLNCDFRLVPKPFIYTSAWVWFKVRSIPSHARRTYKPPEPITAPNSTSSEVMVQLSKGARWPLVVKRYRLAWIINWSSRPPPAFWSISLWSEAIMASMLCCWASGKKISGIIFQVELPTEHFRQSILVCFKITELAVEKLLIGLSCAFALYLKVLNVHKSWYLEICVTDWTWQDRKDYITWNESTEAANRWWYPAMAEILWFLTISNFMNPCFACLCTKTYISSRSLGKMTVEFIPR